MTLDITDNPKESDDDFVIAKTRQYNKPFVVDDAKKLSVYRRNNQGEITAGLTAKTYWNVLHIEFLWVSESLRGQDVGSQILLEAHKEAIKRDCVKATLDTFSFQALGFYQKQGYQLIGSVSGYVNDHTRHYLEKSLVE